MSDRIGPGHYGEERALMAEVRAEQITGEELQRRRWTPADLQTRRHGDPAKVAMAARLR